MTPLGPGEFAALMAPLGPFEAIPRVAIAVSGGADSLALTMLADGWARAHGGHTIALIVDHGLRHASANEATITSERLRARNIASRILPLVGLAHGPALAARARAARYAALEAACAETGIVHLLLGHHAADQAETLAMRMLAGSLPPGLACMAALAETAHVRRLRPLLAIPPGRLRATLVAHGMDWIEDPSNTDPASLRARLRALRGDRDGDGPATRGAVMAAFARGRARGAEDRALADLLARRVDMALEGYALLRPGTLPASALAMVLRVLGGAPWPPSPALVAALAAAPRPATLGGVRMLRAGRMRPGSWLLVREAAAMAPPVPALDGARWDGRYRLEVAGTSFPNAELGALGADAARLRGWSDLPSAVLQTLPAVRAGGELIGVPHLRYPDALRCARYRAVFAPHGALTSAPFVAADFVVPPA